MYKALIRFKDTETNKVYEAGETYPVLGADVSEERVAYLAGTKNKIGKPVITVADAGAKAKADKTKK